MKKDNFSGFGARYFLGVLLLICVISGPSAQAQEDVNPHKVWRQYGGGPDQSKYVEFTQINKSNVTQLAVAWSFAAGDGGYMWNPIVVDDVMYVLGKDESLVALNAETGAKLWTRTNLSGIHRTGINYWESKDRKDRRLLYSRHDRLEAIDARTGELILSFGDQGSVSLKEGLGRDVATVFREQGTSPGQVFENLLLLGSSPGEEYFSAPGHVRAYDVVTGKLAWIFHTIPWPGEFGYETWPTNAYIYGGGCNDWGEITVDEKNGIAFFPLGAPTYDYYGADRTGNDLFGDCLIALDARTGKRLWHFQDVHHDLWDYDLCAAPQLITVQHEGKTVEAVAIACKQGFLFVLDRHTGKPLWPVEERAVPASKMPEEHSSPTQPIPTVIPPFTRQSVSTNDINPYFSPEKKAEWVKRIAAAHTGLFEPLSDQYETIAMPGAVGGANRGNTAADPEHGIVYVITQDLPSVYKLKSEPPIPSDTPGTASTNVAPTPPPSENPATAAHTVYTQSCMPCHGEDMAGRGAIPSIIGVGKRISYRDFANTLGVGKGVMPAFPHLDQRTLAGLYTLIGGDARAARRGRNRLSWAERYPAGVKGPAHNYSTGYGMEYPDLLGPPWSSMVAYDLNQGVIKWRRPLGQDPKIPVIDGKETGLAIGSQRKGMIVTSTGLIFSTCLDGHVYAYDTSNGNKLWSTPLPRNPEGLPAMYEVNGREYLVICDMGKVIDADQARTIAPGYIVYALPK
ncbi:MAG TPA: PQQ-binding-like beta-propeller repeat protein [Verrucomicrobiae bacterium]|jgi:quinoprotein glucose dehydrogenase|nr:PQQ-binding-like beta-propeller repeat protein [Verrucomicrobiae bacterium]